MGNEETTSFMRSLCMGRIEQDLLLPFPTMKAEDQETLQGVAEALGSMLGAHQEDFRAWDREGEFPNSYIEELKEFGAFGLVIPEDAGGLGFGSMAYSRALQEVAKYDASTAVTIGAHSSIGMRGLLLFGTDAQKERYYGKLASGEMVAAFCLTEPGAGSDAASIATVAKRDGDEWVLSGNKLWITNGGIGSFFTVFAKTDSSKRGGMTAFIVTTEMDGVSVGPHEDKMGLRASSTTTVNFDDVRVPADHMLGEEGQGFKVAMKILNSGRTGLGGGSVGAMKKIIELSTAQASERKQFDTPIKDFGLIQQKVGQMVVDCYAAESVVTLVAGLVDAGHQDYAVEAAISKVFATEALWRTADEGLQIAGGNGFMCEFPYERMVRDCRINRIFEGTNDILRLFIALTGMSGVASELKELAAVGSSIFSHPIKGFGVLTDYATKQAQLRTGIRREGSHFTHLLPELGAYADAFEDATRELATATDRLLRKHGKGIIGKQFASRRLAEIMIDLFVWAAVMARVNDAIAADADDADRQTEILHVFAGGATQRIRQQLRRIDDNDDEQIKSLAAHAFEQGRFGWDTI